MGNRPDWKAIREAFPHCILIEDSADTVGHTNPYTDLAITSFYASHVITAGGVGGMMMCNDEAHLRRATTFRDWGRMGDNQEDPSVR